MGTVDTADTAVYGATATPRAAVPMSAVVLKEHFVIATANYIPANDPSSADDLPFAMGQVLQVHDEVDEDGFYEASHTSGPLAGKRGYVPSSHVQDSAPPAGWESADDKRAKITMEEANAQQDEFDVAANVLDGSLGSNASSTDEGAQPPAHDPLSEIGAPLEQRIRKLSHAMTSATNFGTADKEEVQKVQTGAVEWKKVNRNSLKKDKKAKDQVAGGGNADNRNSWLDREKAIEADAQQQGARAAKLQANRQQYDDARNQQKADEAARAEAAKKRSAEKAALASPKRSGKSYLQSQFANRQNLFK